MPFARIATTIHQKPNKYYIKQVEAQLKREREWASEAAVRESIRG